MGVARHCGAHGAVVSLSSGDCSSGALPGLVLGICTLLLAEVAGMTDAKLGKEF